MNNLYEKVKPDQVVQLVDGIEMEFRFISGGTYLQGGEEDSSEQPIWKVTVPDFYLGIYPVTNAQYATFLNSYGQNTVKDGPYSEETLIDKSASCLLETSHGWRPVPGYAHHPLKEVTWYGAHTFCGWLSEMIGKKYRLPTELEWEYAASGGKSGIDTNYSGSHRLCEVGWYEGNSHQDTKPVGLKAPNELGLFDMSGNIFELCEENIRKPRIAKGPGRLLLGGAWSSDVFSCNISRRKGYYGFTRYAGIGVGFRVLCGKLTPSNERLESQSDIDKNADKSVSRKKRAKTSKGLRRLGSRRSSGGN